MAAASTDVADFPVPELVLVALRDIMGFHWSGAGEKVRWSVYCSVAGEPFGFELRKRGFTILHRESGAAMLGRVGGQLKSALVEVETLLQPIAEEQIRRGAVSISNHHAEFEDRYLFFRRLADEAYARAAAPPPPEAAEDGRLPTLVASLNHTLRFSREGFFHSTAMVDAYFSLLEHRVLLLRAFTGRSLAAGELLALLRYKWDDKLKAVIDVRRNQLAAQLLGRLRWIKQRVRNPLAHGGVENDHGSLMFHMPSIGALPANFSKVKNSIRFNFIPVEADDHAGTCAAFDAMDKLMSAGDLAGPYRLLDAGVDPAFDAKSLTAYAKAVREGESGLADYIDSWGRELARHTNMDY